MKKNFALLTLISIIGIYAVGCGSNGNKSDNNTEKTYDVEATNNAEKEEAKEEVKGEEAEEENDQNNDEIAEEKEVNGDGLVEEKDNNSENQKDIGAEGQIVYNFYEAVINKDIEKANQYVLFDDLEPPFDSLEKILDYYADKNYLEITQVEEVSEDMKLYHVKVGTDETSYVEEAYLLKKVDDTWYLALSGLVSWHQSVYTNEQVEDGKIAIYLKDVYRYYNGTDIYVLSIVNNTDEKFNLGFVNRGGIIYENSKKGFIELDQNMITNPYSHEFLYFTVDSSEGPVKSITLKETMLGLQASTSDFEVSIGEMIEKQGANK